jgi:hypothetical protein
MSRFGITAIVAAAAAVLAAAPAHAGERPRPTDAAPSQVVTDVAPNGLAVYDDYATPSRAYASERAVVHYVVLGIDAPPLNDDDGDGVPDYVERVGSAADTAIAYFARRGFAPILPDTGGPDARPDIYVSRFAPGYLGVSYPAALARDGAFVVVSNMLDPSPEGSFGSLYATVAHELFHVVQFSYYPPTEDTPLPSWVLEGTAAAMEGRVYPQVRDLVTSLQLRHWFEAPQRSVTAQSYGAQLLWRYLDEREPGVLPAYLERLAQPRPPEPAAGLAATYARVAGAPFAPAFGRFAAWVESEHAADIRPLRTLAAGGRAGGRVAPLAIHFLRLSRSARSVTLRFTRGRGEAVLTYELRSEYAGEPALTRRVRGRVVAGALVYTMPPGLRGSPRLGTPTLVVADGNVSGSVAYSVSVS